MLDSIRIDAELKDISQFDVLKERIKKVLEATNKKLGEMMSSSGDKPPMTQRITEAINHFSELVKVITESEELDKHIKSGDISVNDVWDVILTWEIDGFNDNDELKNKIKEYLIFRIVWIIKRSILEWNEKPDLWIYKEIGKKLSDELEVELRKTIYEICKKILLSKQTIPGDKYFLNDIEKLLARVAFEIEEWSWDISWKFWSWDYIDKYYTDDCLTIANPTMKLLTLILEIDTSSWWK